MRRLMTLALAVTALCGAFATVWAAEKPATAAPAQPQPGVVSKVSLIELASDKASAPAQRLKPGKTAGNKVLRLGGKPVPDGFATAGNCNLSYDLKGKGERLSGMKGFCDKAHRLGLKAGIYHTPWMTSYGRLCGGTAATPDGKWDPNRPVFAVGPCSFLNQDAKQFAQWGIDYCKWDWILNKAPEIIAVSDSLKQSGRDMVCSLSNRAAFELGPTFVEHANSWRITNDFLAHWEILAGIAFSGDRWAKYAGPGHWLDMDLMVCGVAWGRPCALAPDEQYLTLSMWCLMSSPLMISCELEKLDEFTLRLLTNDEVLDIDQDPLGKPARRRLSDGALDVWVKDLADGSKAVGLFNRGREPLHATVDLGKLGITGPQKVRDLWRRHDLEDCSGSFSVSPRPHGVVLVRMWPRGNG